MRAWAGNIAATVATIFEGMSVTFSHFFRRPYTVQYPDRMALPVVDTLPYRYRGFLDVDLEICTGCLACERACPIDCIRIDATRDKETRLLTLERFDIDLAKCMYCGLCSEPCPTGSIHHTREFEGADFSLESMIRQFIREPVLAYRPKKSGEDDPAIVPILERGMRYVEEFAAPAAPPKMAKAAAGAPAAATKAAPGPVRNAASPAAAAPTGEVESAKKAPAAGAPAPDVKSEEGDA